MNESKKKKFIIVLPILVGTVLLVGISYAWLMLTLNGKNSNAVKGGNLSLVLDDTMTKGIQIEGALPMSDEAGKRQDPYHFTLTNNGTIASRYVIYLDEGDYEEGEQKLDTNLIKYNLYKEKVFDITEPLTEITEERGIVLDEAFIYPGKSYEYDLRLWLDSTIEDPDVIAGKVFRGKIRVEAEQVIETPENCFTVNRNSITDYKCYEGNEEGLPVITDVVIPSKIKGQKITGIWRAFSSKGLTSLFIPEGVTTIDAYAARLNSIKIVGIPNSITTTLGVGGVHAFSDNQIEKVEIPENTTILGGFRINPIKSIYIPEGVTEIASFTFQSSKIKKVEFPSTLITIGSYSFNDSQITEIKLSEGVTTINENAFSENQLTKITIPESVTTLGGHAFYNNQLTSVTIKGKSSISEFESFGNDVFGWAKGSECGTYYNAHKSEENYGLDHNPCIHFEP